MKKMHLTGKFVRLFVLLGLFSSCTTQVKSCFVGEHLRPCLSNVDCQGSEFDSNSIAVCIRLNKALSSPYQDSTTKVCLSYQKQDCSLVSGQSPLSENVISLVAKDPNSSCVPKTCEVDKDCGADGYICKEENGQGKYCEKFVSTDTPCGSCSAATPKCDEKSKKCVACLNSEDCEQPNKECKDGQCVSLRFGCQQDSDCAQHGLNYCHPETKECFQCKSREDCKDDSKGPSCHASGFCGPTCQSNDDCKKNSPRYPYCNTREICVACKSHSHCSLKTNKASVCNPSSGLCESCRFHSDCGKNHACMQGQCIARCQKEDGQSCGNGLTCFGGFCVEKCENDGACKAAKTYCHRFKEQEPDKPKGICLQQCNPKSPNACGLWATCQEQDSKFKCQATCGKEKTICESGQTCHDGICRWSCDSSGIKGDEDCQNRSPDLDTCHDGICVKSCVLNDECSSISDGYEYQCRSGHGDDPFMYCQKKCTHVSDCQPHQVCGSDFRCRDACRTSDDCSTHPTNKKCDVGLCKKECANKDGDCPSGYTCNSNICDKVCKDSNDSDCGDDQYCAVNVCRKRCNDENKSLVCDAGETCVDGRCTFDNTPPKACKTNNDCTSDGKVCADDFCVEPSTSACQTMSCGSDEACVEGVCRKYCENHLACANAMGASVHLVCHKGYCQSCSLQGKPRCPLGYICEEHGAIKTCSSKEDACAKGTCSESCYRIHDSYTNKDSKEVCLSRDDVREERKGSICSTPGSYRFCLDASGSKLFCQFCNRDRVFGECKKQDCSASAFLKQDSNKEP